MQMWIRIQKKFNADVDQNPNEAQYERRSEYTWSSMRIRNQKKLVDRNPNGAQCGSGSGNERCRMRLQNTASLTWTITYLDKCHVDLVHVRSLLSVYLDADKVRVHHLRHLAEKKSSTWDSLACYWIRIQVVGLKENYALFSPKVISKK